MYGTEVSPDFISKVTDEVMTEVTAWQSRPLEPMYRWCSSAIKLISLALRNITDGKVRSAREWKLAMNQFAVLYGDRFVSHVS